MNRYRAKQWYSILGAVILLLIFLHLLGPLLPIERGLRSLVNPILINLVKFKNRANSEPNPAKNNAAATNTQSCNLNQPTLTILDAKVKELTAENDHLKKQLEFKIKQPGRLVVAEVVGGEVNQTEQLTIINRGIADGITVGEPVLSEAGLLVGKIQKTERDISYARLINDNQSKIAATILNHNHSLGVVEGGYGISLRMLLIPRNETILVGDEVITSGLDSGLPRGLLIGTVAVVENEAYKPFQQAILTPLADLSKLTLVSVLVAP